MVTSRLPYEFVFLVLQIIVSQQAGHGNKLPKPILQHYMGFQVTKAENDSSQNRLKRTFVHQHKILVRTVTLL